MKIVSITTGSKIIPKIFLNLKPLQPESEIGKLKREPEVIMTQNVVEEKDMYKKSSKTV